MSACSIFYWVLIGAEHLCFRRFLLALSTFYSFFIRSRGPASSSDLMWQGILQPHAAVSLSLLLPLSSSPFAFEQLWVSQILSLRNTCLSFRTQLKCQLIGDSRPALSAWQRSPPVSPSHAGNMPVSHAQKTVNSRRADSHPPWRFPSWDLAEGLAYTWDSRNIS